MTNDEFYDIVMRRLRRREDTILRGEAPSEVSLVLTTLENSPFHPWFLEKVESLETTADIQVVLMPTDYLLLVEDTHVVITGEDESLPLKRAFHEDLERIFANEETDQPRAYDIFAGNLWLGPVPDNTYAIRLKYYAKTLSPNDNDSQVDNAWILNAPEMVACLTASRLARYVLKNEGLASSLEKDASVIRTELFKYNEARKHVDMDYGVTN